MTRCLLRSIITVSGEDSEALYLQNAEVYVFRTGTTMTPVMYAGPTGGSPLANPILSNSNGEIVVWLDPAEANIIDIRVDSNGGNAYLANQPSQRQGFATFTKTLQAGGPQGVPGSTGSMGATGATGAPGVTVLDVNGVVATSSALPSSAANGDLWIATDTKHGWVWSVGTWYDTGPIVGPAASLATPVGGDLTGTVAAPTIGAGKILDANIAAGADIAPSKIHYDQAADNPQLPGVTPRHLRGAVGDHLLGSGATGDAFNRVELEASGLFFGVDGTAAPSQAIYAPNTARISALGNFGAQEANLTASVIIGDPVGAGVPTVLFGTDTILLRPSTGAGVQAAPCLELPDVSTVPASPASGVRLFAASSTGELYALYPDGTFYQLGAKSPWNTIGGTGQPAFANSWVNYGSPYGSSRFRLGPSGRNVQLDLAVKSGTNETQICVLPVGFRPSSTKFVPAVCATYLAGTVVIGTDGSVLAAINAAWGTAVIGALCSVSGSFPID